MSRKHTIEVFKYSELSADAQARARDWYRQIDAESGDTFWSESVISDFQEALSACGFTCETARGRKSEPAIYFEGFAHQGSGASFSASWRASRVNVAALKKDRPAQYKDQHGALCVCQGNAELQVILDAALALQLLDNEAYGYTSAGRGHSQIDNEYSTDNADAKECDAEDTFNELCGDLAHYLYVQLEREYDYTQSDDAVAENIEANEYEFDADGKRAGF